MSAPCTLWFYTQAAGEGVAALFFTTVTELAGGYASWELMRRIDENNLPNQAKKRKLPTWLCLITSGVSLALEGFVIWAYMHAHATPLTLTAQLGLVDTGLYAVLAYTLALIGVMIVGFHAQRVRLNVREAEGATGGSARPAQPAPVAAEVTERRPYKVCAFCGFTAYTPQAWAGHCGGAEHKRRTAELAATLPSEEERDGYR